MNSIILYTYAAWAPLLRNELFSLHVASHGTETDSPARHRASIDIKFSIVVQIFTVLGIIVMPLSRGDWLHRYPFSTGALKWKLFRSHCFLRLLLELEFLINLPRLCPFLRGGGETAIPFDHPRFNLISLHPPTCSSVHPIQFIILPKVRGASLCTPSIYKMAHKSTNFTTPHYAEVLLRFRNSK